MFDHAAGSCIVEAAGGKVTDIYGEALDFTAGDTLRFNCGIVASSCGQADHRRVIRAVRRAIKMSDLTSHGSHRFPLDLSLEDVSSSQAAARKRMLFGGEAMSL